MTAIPATPLKQTPLYDLHLAAGARIVEFGGWSMPVQYKGIVAEHQAVRSGVGIFDVSHMGKFTLIGEGVLEALQQLVPSNLARLQAGQAQYTVLLNPEAGIIDDVIFYRHADMENSAGKSEHWSVIVNASTTTKDKTWIVNHLNHLGGDRASIQFFDYSNEQMLLAIQGPQALTTLQPLIAEELSQIKRFGHRQAHVLGTPSFVARTGYTGEDGCEIMTDLATGRLLWQKLLDLGVVPCGLGCRDTLRLEAGMHLYGQDMNDATTPLEADLGWVVHLAEKGDFIGRSPLEQQKASGIQRKLVALEMEGRNIARHDYPICYDGEKVGIVTSGTMSPTLGKAIALGYVPTTLAKLGQSLQVQIRNQEYPARVVKRTFYKPAN
ncbi:glycine cleavage system aminomethyltransferase GcvT [Tumidithrix helvetica PCC 7403]|uniref:glycine cleavage system aminomethyltransferase GcvT n=1 Tax=Tumidithrix helvetica TaxID=3457545 RepID=UPI003CA129CA